MKDKHSKHDCDKRNTNMEDNEDSRSRRKNNQ